MGSLQGRAYGIETMLGADWERVRLQAIFEWTRTEQREEAGDAFVPTLLAGRFVVRGFVPADYNSALDQAGFQREQASATR